MPFPWALTRNEMQTASIRFWTRFTDSISCNDNRYVNRTLEYPARFIVLSHSLSRLDQGLLNTCILFSLVDIFRFFSLENLLTHIFFLVSCFFFYCSVNFFLSIFLHLFIYFLLFILLRSQRDLQYTDYILDWVVRPPTHCQQGMSWI